MSTERAERGRVVERAALAKINLVLDVLGPRDDGYTEIATIFQTVALADTVRVRLGGGDGRVSLGVIGDAPCPPGENVAVVAARGVLDAARERRGVELELTKRVPAGAGLGGGSSDAAATILALDELLGHPLDGATLRALGGAVGADVPYFFTGGLALGEGRGDRITPLDDLPELPVVLARTGPPLSTREVFARARAGLTPRDDAPNIRRFLSHLRDGKPGLPPLANGLFPAAAVLRPGMARLSDRLAAAGGRVCMSGSGSAVFGLFSCTEEARAAAERLVAEEPRAWVRVTRTVPRVVEAGGPGGRAR